MKIYSIYKFKLADRVNKIYQYSAKTNPYAEFEGIKQLKLSLTKTQGPFEMYRLLNNDKPFVTVVFSNSKFGYGIIPNSNDIILIKKSIDRIRLLRIIIIVDMRLYVDTVYQMFISGCFDEQIKSLRSSFIQ